MADDDSDLLLRALAHRMSQGVEVKTRKFSLLRFRNVFLGKVWVHVNDQRVAPSRREVHMMLGA